VEKDNVAVVWERGKDSSTSVRAPLTAFDTVRVEITRWHQLCGGLAEIQVFRGAENIARGAAATASGSWHATYLPSAVTDGILSSEQVRTGYWLLPGNTAGWVEVDLRTPARRAEGAR
jgi:hypothetical protein